MWCEIEVLPSYRMQQQQKQQRWKGVKTYKQTNILPYISTYSTVSMYRHPLMDVIRVKCSAPKQTNIHTYGWYTHSYHIILRRVHSVCVTHNKSTHTHTHAHYVMFEMYTARWVCEVWMHGCLVRCGVIVLDRWGVVRPGENMLRMCVSMFECFACLCFKWNEVWQHGYKYSFCWKGHKTRSQYYAYTYTHTCSPNNENNNKSEVTKTTM